MRRKPGKVLFSVAASIILLSLPISAMAQQNNYINFSGRAFQQHTGSNLDGKASRRQLHITYTVARIQQLLANETAQVGQVVSQYETASSSVSSTTDSLSTTAASDLAALQADAQNLSNDITPATLSQGLATLQQQIATLRQQLKYNAGTSLTKLATPIQTAQTNYQNALTALQNAETDSALPSDVNQLVTTFITSAQRYISLMNKYDVQAGATG